MITVDWYLEQKRLGSIKKFLDEKKPQGWFPQDTLKNPEALAYFLRPERPGDKANIPYTGDGPKWSWSAYYGRWLGIGIPDTYTHPKVVLGAYANGKLHDLDIDCDDFALLYYIGLKEIEKNNAYQYLPIKNIQIVTLVAQSFQWTATPPFVYWPSHVVCTFERFDYNLNQWRTGLCDTNGLNWFGSPTEAFVECGKWYNTKYSPKVINYPFGGF